MTLVSPIDTQLVQFNNITLTWLPVPHAQFYVVEVTAPGFVAWKITKTLVNETTVSFSGNVPNNRIINWKVRPYGNWDVCAPAFPVQVGVFKTKNLTATNELESIAEASISPNPIVGGTDAFLNVTSVETFDATVSISDAAGKLLRKTPVRIFQGENPLRIETTDLPAGIFIVSLQTAKGAFVKRLSVID